MSLAVLSDHIKARIKNEPPRVDFFRNLTVGQKFEFKGSNRLKEPIIYQKISRQKVRDLSDGREFHFHPRAICQISA